MRLLRNFFALLLASFSYSEALVGKNDEQVGCIRIYVDPSRIHIFPDGIFFINSQGDLEMASRVCFDEFGLYVLKYYQCPSCGTWNNDNICAKKGCSLYLIK